MRTLLLCVLPLLAGVAAAQPTEKPKPAAREEKPPAPAPRLNLRLDNPAQYARETPKEDADTRSLPGLGAGALPLPPDAPRIRSDAGSPYPKDTAPGVAR